MKRYKILAVDDEKDILELVRYNLEKQGFDVKCADTAEKGIEIARKDRPDMILLDIMLPGMDGFEACKILKNDMMTSKIPIIMLTAKGDEVDVVTGLELGADDYITKPFSTHVLIARIKSALRRKDKVAFNDRSIIKIKELEIDPIRHMVTAKGKQLDLTFTEFKVLQFLAGHPGWVFTRYQIIDAIRGGDYAVTERSVDVQVTGLRKKMGRYGKYVETVRGVGYRFKE
jgi:two-component system phosphate regulon response regulator PhoB